MSWVESMIRASEMGRYRDAVDLQGFAFIELRTLPTGLPLGERPPGLKYPDKPIRDDERMLRLPPAELFGDDRYEATQDVLDGKRKAWQL